MEMVIIFSVALAIGFFVFFDPLTKVRIANDNKRKADVAQIQILLNSYYNDFGKYPQNPSDCTKDKKYCKMVRLDGTTVEWGEDFMPYTDKVPKDPVNKKYVYYATYDGQAYYLYASLDIGQDSQTCNKDGSACDSIVTNDISETVCGGICNYGVSSPNVTP